jgi:DNA polymerase-3 subunit delta
MSEIQHSQLAQHLEKANSDGWPSICLVHGQDVLVERALEQIVTRLLGSADRDLCCEVVEGYAENLPDALEYMNTYGLLAEPKIVIFKEAKLFETRSSQQNLVDQSAHAYETGDLAKASKLFFSLCRRIEADLQTVQQGRAGNADLAALYELIGKDGVSQLVQYGLKRGWSPTEQRDHLAALRTAIDRGFPEHHNLVITSSAKVPKNLKIYKSIAEKGLIVDCHVPLGGRRADKVAQQAVMRQTLDRLLADSGKQLSGPLFEKLCRLTGFDLRTFSQNLEKLIDYSGGRSDITADDIDAVLQRTKSDAVYALTNAMSDRNASQALFYMNTLLRDKWHPLQILAAMANQLRRLLVAKDFIKSESGHAWISGMSYQQFQRQVMPAIEAFDSRIQKQIAQWNESLASEGKGAAGSKKSAADIRLAPNPRNTYPVYQTIVKADKFSRHSIVAAMSKLNQADLKLKSSGQDAAIILKSLLFKVCVDTEEYIADNNYG